MAVYFVLGAALLVAAGAAPPAQPRLYTHSAQLQQINPLDYYLDNPDVSHYYNQQQKQASGETHGAPARLETLEPDSEVELIPGAQPPQQPPQQTPVAPNIPGLVPGQRVFIVHMPVPGYRPGTIGGYQPVYIVAAAPQGNNYAPNGYQNTVFLDPSGQVVSPLVGYQRPGLPHGNPNLVYGRAPLSLNRPYDLVYQEPVVYQPAPAQGVQNSGESLRLSQQLNLQGQSAANEPRPANEAANSEAKKANLQENASKEAAEERRNARPAPPRPKA